MSFSVGGTAIGALTAMLLGLGLGPMASVARGAPPAVHPPLPGIHPSGEQTGASESLSPWTPELDDALRRVLASGCVDGLAPLSALATAPGRSGEIAAQILRLCTDLRGKASGAPGTTAPRPAQPPAADAGLPSFGPPPDATVPDRHGRSRLIPALTLYGLWAGIAFDILADVNGNRTVVLFPLLGMAGGLAGSIVATRDREISNGQAWSIITGLEYGTVSGLLWAGAADASTSKGIVTSGLVAGLAGGGVGLLVAAHRPPAGGVELVRSGGIWGTAASLMLAILSPSEPSSQAILTTAAIGLDAGMLGGALLAWRIPISVNRVLMIDAGALAGLGFGLGGAWLIAGSSGSSRRAIGAGGLVGLAAGIVAAVVLTREMDATADTRPSNPVPALVVYDPDSHHGHFGHFGWGALAVTPVAGPPGAGRAVVGAAATLLGGTF